MLQAATVSEPCTHSDAPGPCPHCGHCGHEMILNGACFYCGEANPEVTNKPKDNDLVPVSQLTRGRDKDES